MKNKLKELFVSELNDMLSAEEQIVKGLPDLIEAADSPDLREAFKHHLEETKHQVERLKEIFTLIKAKPEKEKCKAMKGLIDECSEVIKEYDASALRDAALITKAQ